MQRVWATGIEHDHGPMEWVASISGDSTIDHIRAALTAAVAEGAPIEQCQTGLLAVECVTYVMGGDADLDPLVHTWMRDELRPLADESLRTLALDTLAKLRESSALADHWRAGERQAEWHASLDGLRDRLTTAKRKPDPYKDPTIIALGKAFKKAEPHLRCSLVPYEITDEPIAHMLLAPGLSIVLHYDGVEGLEAVAVPIEHVRAWNRQVKDLAKLAAKHTREDTDIRTHILEHEGFEIAMVFGSTPFTAGLLPHANVLLDAPAPHGLLVGAPFSGCIAYHRILDAKWAEAAVELVAQLREQYETSPQRVTPQLFWLHKGKLVELPYAKLGDETVIQPVEAFVSYVKKLT